MWIAKDKLMDSRVFKRFFRNHLQSQLPEFGFTRNLMYSLPLDYVLNAVIFESSAYKKSRNDIDMYTQPLFMPMAGQAMMVSERLGYFDLDAEDEESVAAKVLALVKNKVLPVFSQYTSSPADIITLFARPKDPSQDPYQIEALAYAFVLIGEWTKAAATLEELLRRLSEDVTKFPDLTYIPEWMERLTVMLALIKSQSPLAVERLEEYRMIALRELHVIKCPSNVSLMIGPKRASPGP